ncbi:hypothetical protein RD792_010842 [Penstemon davidsonii]|uniref:Acid phosphatase n=1 Tax=Penstemon davidsonii TaxID=160366 RepID=A0ABR0D4F3_9LAMI|nr:hypothetical protein RD792_010842 [Penstemon davidsonii]
MSLTRCGIVSLFIILAVSPTPFSQSIIQTSPEKGAHLRRNEISRGVDLYCESWKFTVETNDAGIWSQVPERCVDFVKEYITGQRYLSESEAVADRALAYAKTVEVSGNGKDAWVFDVDETLLSNVPYYNNHGFGSEIFDEHSFNEWVNLGESPALPASVRLYKKLQELGFTIFVLTGRSEFQRNVTGNNLLYAGYSNWERLLLRGDSDQGKLASVFKSEKRKELEDVGYIIHGNSGDQWSDLIGFAVGRRSFKLPNLLYVVP